MNPAPTQIVGGRSRILLMKVKKSSNSLLYILPFLVVSAALLARPIMDMDEIWNYNFGYNICKGLLPYADFNCIVTPLSLWLSALILGLFGNTLFVFRILGAGLLAAVFGLLFVILKLCTKSKVLAFVGAAYMYALCFPVWIYNYNNLNLLLILMILYLELLQEQSNCKRVRLLQAVIGTLYGLIPLCKQSVGGLLLLYNGAICLYEVLRHPGEKRGYGLRLLLSAIPPVLFAVYLLITGSIPDFLDYTVFGIGTFKHSITYLDFVTASPIQLGMGLYPVAVTVFSVITLIKRRSGISRRFHFSALAVSWIGMSVSFPICDYSHFCIGMVPFTICLYCCIKTVSVTRMQAAVCMVLALCVLGFSGGQQLKDARANKTCQLRNFAGLLIDPNLEDTLLQVDNYIYSLEAEGREVILVDAAAAAYLLPMDRYLKDFSLLNMGNLGTKSVEDLLWREDAIYLVRKNRSQMLWQSHFELLDFIEAHYAKVGEGCGFEAYQKQGT